MTDDTRHLPALLQLASSALPVGGFGYSSGLEAAIETGRVKNARDAAEWIGAMLLQVWADGEARHWPILHRAWRDEDFAAFAQANTLALAMRETSELRLESTQTGRSLALWIASLAPDERTQRLVAIRPITHVAAHAAACATLHLPPPLGLHALGWSLIENLALAAVKLIPLGQDDGQRLLRDAAVLLPAAIARVLDTPDRDAGNFAPLLAILSSRHETQYSRLFRS
jgi:urease accessory protein